VPRCQQEDRHHPQRGPHRRTRARPAKRGNQDRPLRQHDLDHDARGQGKDGPPATAHRGRGDRHRDGCDERADESNRHPSLVAITQRDRSRHPPIKPDRGQDGVVTRRQAYFVLMGTCVALITLAWVVVRLVSVTAAVVMSVIAMVIPPIAVVIGNAGQPDDRG
jgi:hypothetical protein